MIGKLIARASVSFALLKSYLDGAHDWEPDSWQTPVPHDLVARCSKIRNAHAATVGTVDGGR